MFELLLAAATHGATVGFGSPADIWNSIVTDFSNITEPAAFATFVQVLMIDLVLAGDNAIVVGALAAGLPADQRKKVILFGVIAALVLRIVFALVVTQLMQVIGLSFSVLLMGFEANYVARLIQRYHWINYVGLAVILYVAATMIYEGWVGGEHVLGLRKVLGLG